MSQLLDMLAARIAARTATIGVVGLGYVGLPVACQFAATGFRVVGVDLKADRVDLINRGVSPIQGNEPGLDDLLAQVVRSGKLKATTGPADALADADVITINVDTPVDDSDHLPRYAALESACRAVGSAIKPGALVIVESTIAPGTMAGLVRPVLESTSGLQVGQALFLGHCPERVMPGRLLLNLRSMSRVCGGSDDATAKVMVALYRSIVEADLDTADCVTAELVKTAENAYRDVNIAFANEVALICEDVGADVMRVRDLVNKSPGRLMLLPGAGVGGHCIPKDPWLLAAGARESTALRLIPAARAVNESMPEHVANLLVAGLREASIEPRDASVVILGYSYLENSDDTRHSPTQALLDHLGQRGIQYAVHDPHVPGYDGDLETLAAGSDALVLMVAHDAYRGLNLAALRARLRTPIVVDARNYFEPAALAAAGFAYLGVGKEASINGPTRGAADAHRWRRADRLSRR